MFFTSIWVVMHIHIAINFYLIMINQNAQMVKKGFYDFLGLEEERDIPIFKE